MGILCHLLNKLQLKLNGNRIFDPNFSINVTTLIKLCIGVGEAMNTSIYLKHKRLDINNNEYIIAFSYNSLALF